MAYIEFNNVTKEYKTGETSIKALDGASFSVEKGELAVILGSSGAGKTTALNILGGMDVPTAGGIKVDGRDIAKYNKSSSSDTGVPISGLYSSSTIWCRISQR